MNRRKTARDTAALLGSALVVLALTSCGTAAAPGGGSGPRSITGNWQLTDARDAKGDIRTEPAVVTFTVDGDRSGGHGPCNSFGATTRGTTTGTISIVVGIHTDMACSDQELNAAEGRYFDALGTVTQATMIGDTLRLSGGGDVLVFTRAKR